MPRLCSHSRSAPVTTASTTSLTVPPSVSLIRLKVASSERAQVKRRCGPIGWFSGTSGAGSAKAPTTSPTPSSASPTRRAAVSGWRTASTARSTSFTGAAAASTAPRATSSAVLGCGLRHPAVLARGRLRHRLEVEEHGADVDAGDAVDHRVVGLGQQGEAVALQALHQPQLPERLGAVELLREDARGEALQLLLAARLGQRRVADVVGQVEVDVVGPERPPGLQRRHDQPLAEARHLARAARARARPGRRTSAAAPRRSGSRRRACGWPRSRWSGTRRRPRSAGRGGRPCVAILQG